MPLLNARKAGAVLAGACMASATLTAVSFADTPPAAGHKITVLPDRDTVVGTGYAEGVAARVVVLRYDAAAAKFNVVSRSEPIQPVDDPATADVFDGIVAVNRADGGCWREITPDIRAGDRVRIIQRDAETGELISNDSAVTGSVTTGAAEVVFDAERGRYFAEVHGVAPRIALGTGQPVEGRVPLTQLQVRVTNEDGFASSGTRALVSGVNGTLRYDSADTNDSRWTARFPIRAIDQAEVEAAVTRALWLGRDPEAGNELTVAENRVGGIKGGPRAGCDAPAEGAPEAATRVVDAAVSAEDGE